MATEADPPSALCTCVEEPLCCAVATCCWGCTAEDAVNKTQPGALTRWARVALFCLVPCLAGAYAKKAAMERANADYGILDCLHGCILPCHAAAHAWQTANRCERLQSMRLARKIAGQKNLPPGPVFMSPP